MQKLTRLRLVASRRLYGKQERILNIKDNLTLHDFIKNATIQQQQQPHATRTTTTAAAPSILPKHFQQHYNASTHSENDDSSSLVATTTTTTTIRNKQPKFLLETYGCQMNVNDSEIIHSILQQHHYVQTDTVQDAQVVLLNTCAIRENAEQRIWNRLYQLQGINRQRPKHDKMIVGLLGCMAERLKTQLLQPPPPPSNHHSNNNNNNNNTSTTLHSNRLVDLIVGPDAYRDLPLLLSKLHNDEYDVAVNVLLSMDETYADIQPVHENGTTSAFVTIMRGCNNMCSYCIVPFTRGRERSRNVQSK